jgi:DNA-binding IclR family transcriptional regulator
LSETRRRGYAIEQGEVTPGLASVAAPVLDHNQHPVAGLAVTFADGEPDVLAEEVGRAATALTKRLGGPV